MFGFEPGESRTPIPTGEEVACLMSGNVRLVLRQGTAASSSIARYVAEHGDSIADVALICGDVAALVDRALGHGLKVSNENGCPRIDVLGDGMILHSLRNRSVVSRSDLQGRPRGPQPKDVDHVTYCLPWGTMDRVATAYREVFALEAVYAQDVEVEERGISSGVADGMRSTVLRSALGLTVVLTEPMSPVGDGQTHRFLRSRAGPGVQHVALAYDDIVAAVGTLLSNGVPFFPVPEKHLELSHEKFHGQVLPWLDLRRLEILVDADEHGLLFQRFSRPIIDRGSFFIELIQRAGATGFGARNVRALFAAVDAAIQVPSSSWNGPPDHDHEPKM
jgi:4-hydroxyphenylpyruvate dioxygenase